jgi:hypothetical protein
LEPIISAGTGELAYIENQQGLSGTCEAIELTPAEVALADKAARAGIATAVATIEAILDDGSVTCSDLIALQLELLLDGRAKPFAMSKIAGLVCGICSSLEITYTITPDATLTLQLIIEFLTKEPINSTVNCIFIYVDHHGIIMEPPKIGGSRAELDWEFDDPDCDEPPTTPDTHGVQPTPAPVSGPCVSPKEVSNGVCVCPDPEFTADVN